MLLIRAFNLTSGRSTLAELLVSVHSSLLRDGKWLVMDKACQVEFQTQNTPTIHKLCINFVE